jgi:hypothetical protein
MVYPTNVVLEKDGEEYDSGKIKSSIKKTERLKSKLEKSRVEHNTNRIVSHKLYQLNSVSR